MKEATTPLAIWIVGAGGIGSAFGGRLATHHRVTFVDRWADHVAAIRSVGLVVTYPDGTVRVHAPAYTVEQAAAGVDETPDVVVLAVKSSDTVPVLVELAPVIGEAPVVSLQNGLNENDIADVVGLERTVGAVVRFDGRLDAPGRATQTRGGTLVIGEAAGPATPRTAWLAGALGTAVPVEVSDRIVDVLWSKLVLNCTMNAVSALADIDLAALVEDLSLVRACVALGAEAAAVASAAGVTLSSTTLFDVDQEALARFQGDALVLFAQRFRSSYAGQPDLQPSMLQDVRRGRPTEIDALNGAVVRLGARAGVPTPRNSLVVDLVRRVEAGARWPVPDLVAQLSTPDFSKEPA